MINMLFLEETLMTCTNSMVQLGRICWIDINSLSRYKYFRNSRYYLYMDAHIAKWSARDWPLAGHLFIPPGPFAFGSLCPFWAVSMSWTALMISGHVHPRPLCCVAVVWTDLRAACAATIICRHTCRQTRHVITIHRCQITKCNTTTALAHAHRYT